MCGTTAAQLLTAALSRAVLLAHAALVSWRAVTVRHGDGFLWVLLLLGAALLPLEMAFTTRLTQRGEWKWLSPMVLLYLASVVPSVWILELDLLEGRIAHLNLSASTTSSSSSTSAPEQTTAPLSVSGVPFGGNNGGNGGGPDAATALSEAWVLALQQLMLVALVLARWLTPALGVSRAALSRLLLAQTGVAADVLDLLDAFKQPEVRADRAVRLAGLALFSWASLQFCVALMQAEEAATAGGAVASAAGAGAKRRTSSSARRRPCRCPMESLQLLSSVLMQDAPFLAFRLYLLAQVGVVNQTTVFFTCKNALTLLVELYGAATAAAATTA
ncbi:transmembrane protein 26-like [Lampetra fluviatilis]